MEPTTPSAPSAPTATSGAATPSTSAAPARAPASPSQTGTAPKAGVGSQVEPKAPAAAAPEPPAKRKHTFKIDGKEIVREFSPEEELTHIQKGLAADQRFRELAAREAEIKKLLEMGKTMDPGEAAKKLWGVNLEEWAEKKLAEKFQRATMSEEERKALELQEERDRYKKQVDEYENQRKTTAQREYEDKVASEFDKEILQALQTTGLEKNRATLHLVADVYDAAMAHGIELSPAQAAQEARARALEFAKGTVFKLKGPALLEALGADVVNEIIQAEVGRRRGAVTAPPAPAAPVQARPSPRVPTQVAAPKEEPQVSRTRTRVMRRFGLE